MFKKVKNAVGNLFSSVANKAKTIVAVIVGGFLAANASAQSALDGFVSTNETTGDPVVDPSKPVNMMKTVIVSGYEAWMGYAIIIVLVTIVLMVIFRKKG